MSITIEFQGTLHSQAHSSTPLDEIVWRAWLKKNLLQERQRAGVRIKAVKWTCISVLMATAVVSSYVSPSYLSAYQAVARFAIALGAIVIMFKSLRERQYVFTALFAGIVLLFNPVLATFSLSGNWPILLASVLPFAASLIWMKERPRRIIVPASAVD